MIFLYVKQHSKTGLKYFGKTTRDPLKYNGSGKYWMRHIKQYGKEHIETLEVYSFETIDECSNFAIEFSKKNNIVESKEWANLVVEDALNGVKGLKHSLETKQRMSDAAKGKILTEETKSKISKARLGMKMSIDSIEKSRQKRKGQKRSSEQRENMSRGQTGIKHSDERKQKFIDRLQLNHPIRGKFGENNPNYGSKRSDETKLKMSQAQSGEKHSQYGKRGKLSHNYGTKRNDKTKKLMSEKKIGKTRYYHPDCLTYKWFNPGLEPEGWSRNKCQHT